MQAHATRRQREEYAEVPQRERLGLEHRLEERDVDEGQLGEERDGHGEEEELVGAPGEEGDVEAAVLKRRGEVEEDEGGERLRGGGWLLVIGPGGIWRRGMVPSFGLGKPSRRHPARGRG